MGEEELAAFEAFLEAQGIDLSSMGGPGGSAKQRMQFMQQMMAMQMGMEDELEHEEEMKPRGKKAGKAADGAGAQKGKGAAAGAAAGAGAGKPGVPKGTNKPGDLKCSSCEQLRNKDLYSSAQQKKKGHRRCNQSTDADAGASTPHDATTAGNSSMAAAAATKPAAH